MTEETPKNKPWAWIIALVIGGGILLLAWDRFGFGSDAPLAGGQNLVEQTAADASLWTLTDETDPMTDEQILSAFRPIEGVGFLIETTIVCRPSSGAITYQFSAFDPYGEEPANFRAVLDNSLSTNHFAQTRADSGEPQNRTDRSPRYTNAFDVDDNGNGDFYDQLALAQQLTIKLDLQQGQPVFVIDQTDAGLAPMLTQCVQAQSARRDQATSRRAQVTQDLQEQYRQLDAMPSAQLTTEQRRELVSIRFRLTGLTGEEMPPLRADVEDTAASLDANRQQQQEEAAARVARDSAYQQERASEQAELCKSIERTGAGSDDYRRSMGC